MALLPRATLAALLSIPLLYMAATPAVADPGGTTPAGCAGATEPCTGEPMPMPPADPAPAPDRAPAPDPTPAPEPVVLLNPSPTPVVVLPAPTPPELPEPPTAEDPETPFTAVPDGS